MMQPESEVSGFWMEGGGRRWRGREEVERWKWVRGKKVAGGLEGCGGDG